MRRILIVDDNQTLRHALKGMLSQREDWIVCGEAANGRNDPYVPIAMYTLLDQSVRFESEAQRIGVRKVISKTDMFQSLVSSLDDMAASPQNQPKRP